MLTPALRAYDVGFRVALCVPTAPEIKDHRKASKETQDLKEAREAENEKDANKAIQAQGAASGGPAKGANWTSPSTKMEFVWVRALGIWVGKYTTTNGEYRRKEPLHHSGTFLKYSLDGDRQPVVMAGFDQARAYAEWLTARDREQGRLPKGYRYRLPTEDEWLAFARCGEAVEYPWGNDLPPKFGNYRGQEAEGRGDKLANYRDKYPAACNVEQSGRNRWGLYGVGGNVWQACATDRSGVEPGSWRGGSWDSGSPRLLRARSAASTCRTIASITMGFAWFCLGMRVIASGHETQRSGSSPQSGTSDNICCRARFWLAMNRTGKIAGGFAWSPAVGAACCFALKTDIDISATDGRGAIRLIVILKAPDLEYVGLPGRLCVNGRPLSLSLHNIEEKTVPMLCPTGPPLRGISACRGTIGTVLALLGPVPAL